MLKKMLGEYSKAIIFMVIGCLFFYNVTALQKNEKPEKTEVTVDTEQVDYQKIPEYISAMGTLIAVKSTALSFLVDGHLAQKFFHNGDSVKKNDVVAKLDNSTIISQLASAQANLNEAQSNYKRYELLKDSGVFSKQDYISISTQLKVAKAQYASVLEQQQQLSLPAPFSGTLSKYNFSVGAEIKAGMPVVNLVQLNPLKVSYYLSQKEKGAVCTGQSVLVKSEIWPDMTFTGKVVYISPTIDPDTGQFEVESLLQNNNHKLSPGELVHVNHILNPGRNMLVINQKSVVVDKNSSYVYIIHNNKAYKQNILTGKFTDDGNVVILKGLKYGDEVVVNGVQKLSEGTLVKISTRIVKSKKIVTKSIQKATKTKLIADNTKKDSVTEIKSDLAEKSSKEYKQNPVVNQKNEQLKLNNIKKINPDNVEKNSKKQEIPDKIHSNDKIKNTQ
ncbi:MAG: efflux RND transporter periplasmic adaptor subunit [Endozoicomonadaceae bacterium]|nr:efflux RND transporter periplasmic adaptor subunit [Endozoicomonadaceae bacterium]